METRKIDEHIARSAANKGTSHPDYLILAARISISNLHKETSDVFSNVVYNLYWHCDSKTGKHNPKVSLELNELVRRNAQRLNEAIVHERDLYFGYFGYKTLEKSYLLKLEGKVVERPQYMWMRVALEIHRNDIDSAIETYNLMSQKYFTHASPTLFNAGTLHPQLSSCFLLQPNDSSNVSGIYDALKQCAEISTSGGGIGLSVTDIFAERSDFSGTIPVIRVFNNAACQASQGGNRPGAFAIYMELWHPDIFKFLELKKNTGEEKERARDLFYGLWVPDLFMKRVEEDDNWSLFCPSEAPRLSDVWGDEFERLYTSYEQKGLAREVVRARDLMFKIIESQAETGTPYMLYKDSCNKKSNQQNLGTIKCSNLCAEIIEYSSPSETAVCNLASLALPRFVNKDRTDFDFKELHRVVQIVTRNLDKIIDNNCYPTIEARTSNNRHRPIGIGVQGLADVFALRGFPFESNEAKELNRDIFETIYHAALTASCGLAEQKGVYESYSGSPISRGELQYDLWGVKPSKRWDWDGLKKGIAKYGVRNSQLVALMPTASTSQILGFNECFEPYTSNIYTRRTLAGTFQVVNGLLIEALIKLDLWSDEMRQRIMLANGSIQKIPEIPDNIKAIFKTVWEIPQKVIVDMAVDRGPFVDQSQSLNIFFEKPDFQKIMSMHFYAWKKGLKTGMYYLRTRPAADPIKVCKKKKHSIKKM